MWTTSSAGPAALLLGVAAVLAGCAGGSASDGTAGPAAGTPVTSSTAADATGTGSTAPGTAVTGTAAAGTTAAAGAQPKFPVESTEQSIEFGGTERTFRVHRPEHLPAAAPLVVVLHGALSAGVGAETDYGFDRPADQAGFVVAYPDGLDHVWNAGGCCGTAVTNRVDDVGFIGAMVDRIGEQIPLDPARIYVAGMSNGGMMAYALACGTDRFAAIGAVSAT